MCKNYNKYGDLARLREDNMFFDIEGLDNEHRLTFLMVYMVKSSNPKENVDFTMERVASSTAVAHDDTVMHGETNAVMKGMREHTPATPMVITAKTNEKKYLKALEEHNKYLIDRFYEHKADWIILEILGELGEYKCLPKYDVEWLKGTIEKAHIRWSKLQTIGTIAYRRNYKLKGMSTRECICHQQTPKNQVLMYHIPTKNHVVIGNECVARFLGNNLNIHLMNYRLHGRKMPSDLMIEDAIDRGFIYNKFDKKSVLPFGFIRYLLETKAMPTVDLTIVENGKLYRLGFGDKKKETLYYLKDLTKVYTKEVVYREVKKGEKLTLFKNGDLSKIDKEDARKYIYLRGSQND